MLDGEPLEETLSQLSLGTSLPLEVRSGDCPSSPVSFTSSSEAALQEVTEAGVCAWADPKRACFSFFSVRMQLPQCPGFYPHSTWDGFSHPGRKCSHCPGISFLREASTLILLASSLKQWPMPSKVMLLWWLEVGGVGVGGWPMQGSWRQPWLWWTNSEESWSSWLIGNKEPA